MPLNRERAYSSMQNRGLDAIIASSLENVFYISDYWSLGQQFRCGTNTFALLPLDGEPVIVAPLNECDLIVDSKTWIKDVFFYGDFNVDVAKSDNVSEETQRLIDLYNSTEPDTDPVAGLLAALEEREIERGVLALDTTGITPRLFETLKGKLPDLKLLEGADLLQKVRFIKTEEEVELIQRATEITEKSMEDALEIARSEIMELDLAGMFGYSVGYDGGRITQNLIGFHERSAFLHPLPTTLEAKKRDLIRMTLGCTWHHYHSNISRTAVIGRPLSRVKKRWEAVLNAQEAALDVVIPGAKLSDVYSAAEKELQTAGLKTYSDSLGHGIGVECNERPWIKKDSDVELEEGMVINIDVPYLELGAEGVQIEDTVLVTSKGFKLLTKTDRNLYLL